jgi:Fic family protein
MTPPRDCTVLGETSGYRCRRADSGRSQGRFPPRPQLGPGLSETRSDDQELREADAARRGLGNSERNCGESRTRETHSVSTREEPNQRQDDGRYQQQQDAQIHEGPVIVHPTLA